MKEHSANSIRYLFSQTHYSGPLNFSKELLESSEKGLEKIYNLVQRIENIKPSMADNLNTFENERYLFAFESAMDDNFNTPQALASIYDFIRDFNKFLNKNDQVAKNDIIKAKDFLTKTLTDVLGIVLFSTEEKGESKEDDLIKLLIEIRQKAKLDKNYSLADEIRNKLSELGITLADSKEGTTYKISK